jgi:hypothetical protein
MEIKTFVAILSAATCLGCSDSPHATISPVQSRPTSGMYSNALTYTIQYGDTLAGVSRLFLLREDDIVKANPQLQKNAPLTPGQPILIPYPANLK